MTTGDGFRVVHMLDRVASSLEAKGHLKEAEEVDAVANAAQEQATDPTRQKFYYPLLKSNHPDVVRAMPRNIVAAMEAMGDPEFVWGQNALHAYYKDDSLAPSLIRAFAAVPSLSGVEIYQTEKYGEYMNDGFVIQFKIGITPQFQQQATAMLTEALRKKQYAEFDPSI